MSGISAFIGHSFEESDREVVNSFLEFFDTLKKSEIINDWDHAVEAQAIEVGQKVKEKMRGKSLFVGICTKKERVIRNEKLKKWNYPVRLFSMEIDFEWKASDWVLQELGYSLGLEMKAILLLEEGVREIKGLHGNLEFVRFDRSNPSLAFQKIIQQLSSIERSQLNPEQPDELAKSPDAKDSETTKVQSSSFDYEKPNVDWKYSDFTWAMMFAIWNKNLNAEKEINEFHEKLLSHDHTQLVAWKGEYLVLKQKWKNESSLSELDTLIRANPENINLHFSLGNALEELKSFSNAYDEYSKALITGSSWNIQFLAPTIRCLVEHKGNDAAKAFMEINFEKIVKEEKGRLQFIKIYSTLFKDDSPYVYCALLEGYLNIQPDDSALRFELAYKYSELNMKKLSLFHYSLLSRTNPNESNWNNLGVEYEKNDLSIKSIIAYRESEKLAGTLSMSNIAYRFLHAGFEKEAREICNKALLIEGYDPRIPEVIKAINDKIEAENKVINELNDEIKPDQSYFVKYAKLLAMPLIKDRSGRFKASECELDFVISGGKFKASGVYERETSGLGGLLSLGNPYKASTESPPKQNITYDITYQGVFRGCAGTFKITRGSRSNVGAASSVLSSGQDAKEGMLYFDEACNEFEVIEFSSSGQPLKPYKLEVQLA